MTKSTGMYVSELGSGDWSLVMNKIYLILILLASIYILAAETQSNDLDDDYKENLFIKPLVDGKLYAQFQFTTNYRKDIKSLRWENKFLIFPLSIADLVATTDLIKLHFSLTKGNWNYRNWGYPTRPSPPGAQIRVQFSQHNENQERSWKRLVNSLSGKFCASLASADKTILASSKLAFSTQDSPSRNSTKQYLYANLPEETFCTENLTPWKKLLPCYSKSGLASLLNAVNLLRSSYSSLAVDLEPKPCIKEGQIIPGCEQVQLIQTITMVFNPLHLFEGKQTWSLTKIFGNSIQRRCPLASESRIYVDITNLDDRSKLYPSTYKEHNLEIELDDKRVEKRAYAIFDVNSAFKNATDKLEFNLGIKQTQLFKQPPLSKRPSIPVSFRTHVAGVGMGDGTIVATITNDFDKSIRITYLDVVPHFLPVYLHTLTVKTSSGQELKPDKLNFVLSKDKAPTLIEFSIVIPPATEAQISYDFDRAFLRWSDYKPDANKGVLLGSASISISLSSGLQHLVLPASSLSSGAEFLESESTSEGEVTRIYARPLLIILPTPDFSMPYNVICLVCSALATAFSTLHSLTSTKPKIKVNTKNLEKEEKKEELQESKKDQ